MPEYRKFLKHVSTTWLSLERWVQRTLEKYKGLKSHFLSEEFADQRFSRLRDAFTNPLTEVALLFHHASIPLFNNFNKLLKSEEPIIHMLHDSMTQLARSLCGGILLSLSHCGGETGLRPNVLMDLKRRWMELRLRRMLQPLPRTGGREIECSQMF